MTMARRCMIGSLLVAGLCGCDSDDPICDADELASALAEARSGDTVEMGTCTITGAFVVPNGVTLAGQGTGESVLVSPAGGVAVTLEAGSETALRAIGVETDGAAGVVVRGSGDAVLSIVTVTATAGVGIGAEGAANLTLSDTKVSGPITAANAGTLGAVPTIGIVLVDVASAALLNVDVTGFGEIGVLSVESGLAWNGGSASETMGTGLMVVGGTAALLETEFCREIDPGDILPFGAIFAGGFPGTSKPTVTWSGANVCDNPAVGVFVWDSPSFTFGGTASARATVTGNGGIGLLVSDTTSVLVDNADFLSTRSMTLPVGENEEPVLVGDGVELIRSFETISFTDVLMEDNERAQLMIDLGRNDITDLGETWAANVNAAGAQLGAVCQGFPPEDTVPEAWPPEGESPDAEDLWDLGIVRNQTAKDNDHVSVGVALPYNPEIALEPPRCFMPDPTAIIASGLSGAGVP